MKRRSFLSGLAGASALPFVHPLTDGEAAVSQGRTEESWHAGRPSAPARSPTPEQAAAQEWFQDAKFGLFIHWGVYSVLGKGAWVRLAKDAGMRYITITSKHHDGFAMWDSDVSDYNIVQATLNPYSYPVGSTISGKHLRDLFLPGSPLGHVSRVSQACSRPKQQR